MMAQVIRVVDDKGLTQGPPASALLCSLLATHACAWSVGAAIL